MWPRCSAIDPPSSGSHGHLLQPHASLLHDQACVIAFPALIYLRAAGTMTGDLDNPGRLEDSWDEALHQARCLKDFGHWLRTPPGRRKLFAAYCRHALPDQWDRFL